MLLVEAAKWQWAERACYQAVVCGTERHRRQDVIPNLNRLRLVFDGRELGLARQQPLDLPDEQGAVLGAGGDPRTVRAVRQGADPGVRRVQLQPKLAALKIEQRNGRAAGSGDAGCQIPSVRTVCHRANAPWPIREHRLAALAEVEEIGGAVLAHGCPAAPVRVV